MPTPCGDGTFISTTIHANQLLGYTESRLATLMSPMANYTITASAGPNGTIAGSGDVSVNPGMDQTFIMTPDPGYHVDNVVVDGSSVGPVNSYIFNDVYEDHTISVTFAANPTYTIAANAGANGSISPGGITPVPGGTDITYSITPNAGYKVATLTVDGATQNPQTTYIFRNVSSNHTIDATFVQDVTYYITAEVRGSGTISPEGQVSVSKGDSASFTITPSAGYKVSRVIVDGSNKGAITSYTFNNVTYNHSIKAYFILQ